MLGYTQVSWDNLSGQEQQPWSSDKFWASLTDNEESAAVLLGYTQKAWDNESGSEQQPHSSFKSWRELTACGAGEDATQSLTRSLYYRFLSGNYPRSYTRTRAL